MDVVIRWEKMGSEFSYHVWYSKNVTGPWVRANSIRLTDSTIDTYPYDEPTEYNEYTVHGLDSDTNYSFKVTCYDRYNAWWYSYTGAGSLDGGLGMPGSRPDPDSGNIAGFQFYVDIP